MKVDEFKNKVASGEIQMGDKRRTYGNVDPAYTALLKNIESGKKKSSRKPRKQQKKRHEYLTKESIEKLMDHYFKQGSIYIPYNVVSSKNSNRIITTKGGKKMLIHSVAYMAYAKLTKPYWKKCRMLWNKLTEDLEKPYKVGFFCVRYSDDRFDFHNMEQGPADLMQEFNWIEDDDKKSIKIIPEGYRVDKMAQGIIITPLKDYEDAQDNRE
jgi:hypothetical protein